MTLFCGYKNALGEPDKGVHKYRFGGIAIVDFLMTLGLSAFTSYGSGMPLVLTTILWLVFSIGVHYIFCVQSATNKYLGIV